MALVQSTLASGLEAMVPTDSESEAIDSFVSAWDSYFAGASVNGAQANAASYDAGLSAMTGAMTGLSTDGAAAIQAGVVAFWAAIAALATSIWTTAPVVLVPPIVPPAGVTGISAALAGVFASNTAGELSLADSASAIAAALHTASLEAIVPGSVPPAPPAPLPIL